MTETKYTKTVDWYRSRFKIFEENLNGQQSSELHALRRKGLESFAEKGFPSTRDEEWKYTNVESIAGNEFLPAILSEEATANENEIRRHFMSEAEAYRLVFVNGRFKPEFSATENLPEGAIVSGLSEQMNSDHETVQALAEQAVFEEDAFTALSTAFISDGAFVYLPENVQLDKPIQLLFVSADAEQPQLIQPRNLIVAERGAAAEIIEYFVADGSKMNFTNCVSEISLGANAGIGHVVLQQENLNSFHVGSTFVRLQNDSRYRSQAINFGGKLVRHNINAILDGEGIETTLNGVYVADGDQHIDNHTAIHHAKPNCESHELYKGILNGKAKGVFNGKIFVHPDAQKTNAVQGNHALLLSENAGVDTKPQLEIYADDVKCTHGATIGQIDDDALFYLRARGIGTGKAHQLLIYAFASEIIDQIQPDSLREKIAHLLAEKLHTVEPV